MLKRVFGAMGLAIAMQTAMSQEAPMPPLRPDQVAFRALYKELVETNTTFRWAAARCRPSTSRHTSRPQVIRQGLDVVFRARSSQGRRSRRGVRGNLEHREAHAAAGPSGCGRGQARGLDARPVQDGRGKRLFLWPRRRRHEGHGRHLGRCDALQKERLSAETHHQAGIDLRRGDDLCLQRRAVAGEEQAGVHRRGFCAE